MTDGRLSVVIMAAGKGTRMKNPALAKVMYEIEGIPLIDYVINISAQCGATRSVVVLGWQKEAVMQHLARHGSSVVWVEQIPQQGTGHAVMQAREALQDFHGDVLVLSGDVPLLRATTVADLITTHRSTGASATLLTAVLDDPTGYGRVLRNEAGSVRSIVEQRDASPSEQAVREINSGIYVFDCNLLFEGLESISPHNAQNEYYLTDVFGYFWKEQRRVSAVCTDDPSEIMGINTPEQLEQARQIVAGMKGS